MRFPTPEEIEEKQLEIAISIITPRLKRGLRIVFGSRPDWVESSKEAIYLDIAGNTQHAIEKALKDAGWEYDSSPETYKYFASLTIK